MYLAAPLGITDVFSFFLFILMVNGIPADICGFLGAAVLELIISWRGKAA